MAAERCRWLPALSHMRGVDGCLIARESARWLAAYMHTGSRQEAPSSRSPVHVYFCRSPPNHPLITPRAAPTRRIPCRVRIPRRGSVFGGGSPGGVLGHGGLSSHGQLSRSLGRLRRHFLGERACGFSSHGNLGGDGRSSQVGHGVGSGGAGHGVGGEGSGDSGEGCEARGNASEAPSVGIERDGAEGAAA